MTDVPRRLRPDSSKRANTILKHTRGASSAQGSTAAARPVAAVNRSRTFVPPVAGGPIASATFRDTRSGLAMGTIGDPSVLLRSQGDAGRFFQYNGSDGVVLLLPGWYQVASAGVIGSATPGDAFRAFCFFTTPQTVEGSDIATASGTANPTAMSLPFYDDGSGSVIQVSIENHTGSSGVVNGMDIHLVAFGMAAA